LRHLQAADLGRIRLQYPNYPFPDVFRAIEASIDWLSPDSRRRYLEMAVFPNHTPIPPSALAALWETSTEDAEDQVHEWIVQSLGAGIGYGIQLHDLQSACVRQQYGPARDLHKRIVAGYRKLCQHGWGNGPDDGYFFTWIAAHLKEGRGDTDLAALLLDADWLRSKLQLKGVAAPLSDFDLVEGQSVAGMVGEALRLSAHILARDASQLAGQLLARLSGCDAPEARRLLSDLRTSQSLPWIELVGGVLGGPGGPLLATLSEHRAEVLALAFGPGHDRLMSASKDGTIKTWDLRRWECVETVHWSVGDRSALAAALVPDRGWCCPGPFLSSAKSWFQTFTRVSLQN
jgi:WD40 repeat protein